MENYLLKDCPFCGGKAEQKYSDGVCLRLRAA